MIVMFSHCVKLSERGTNAERCENLENKTMERVVFTPEIPLNMLEII